MPETPSLTRSEVRRLIGEAYGKWYWLRRGVAAQKTGERALYPHATREEVVAEILKMRQLRKLLKTAPPDRNEHGNAVYYGTDASERLGIWGAEARYKYDVELGAGWTQYDTRQDAWYFGVWVNVKERLIFSYAEGDKTLVECPSIDSFKAELLDMERFYGPPPPAFIVCDDIGLGEHGTIMPKGNVQLFFNDRPTAVEG